MPTESEKPDAGKSEQPEPEMHWILAAIARKWPALKAYIVHFAFLAAGSIVMIFLYDKFILPGKDSQIAEKQERIDGLKEDIEKLKPDAEKLNKVQEELNQLKGETKVLNRFFELYQQSENDKTRLKVTLESYQTETKELTDQLFFAKEEIRLRRGQSQDTNNDSAYYGSVEFNLNNYVLSTEFYELAFPSNLSWDALKTRSAPFFACATLLAENPKGEVNRRFMESDGRFHAALEDMTNWINKVVINPDLDRLSANPNNILATLDGLKRIQPLLTEANSNFVGRIILTVQQLETTSSNQYYAPQRSTTGK